MNNLTLIKTHIKEYDGRKCRGFLKFGNSFCAIGAGLHILMRYEQIPPVSSDMEFEDINYFQILKDLGITALQISNMISANDSTDALPSEIWSKI